MPSMLTATQRIANVHGQRVIIADARDVPSVPSSCVACFVTSPPYWNLKDYGNREQIGQGSYEANLDDLNEVWRECYRCAADNAVLIVSVNSRRHQKRFYPIAFDIVARMEGWRLWDHVVWYVPNALPQPNHYMERLLDNKHESCLVFTKDGSTDFTFHKPRVPQKYLTADPRAHKKNSRGRCIGNVVRVPAYRPPNVRQMNYHVAAFPEELVAFFLECYTDPGDVAMDPFLGSGTTLKVCRVMGRRGVGCEINPDYLPLIEKRIAEPWAVPDWRNLDIHHSSTMTPGSNGTRKSHFARAGDANGEGSLFNPS